MSDGDPLIKQINSAAVDVVYNVGATANRSIYHMSDLHLDSPYCDRQQLERDLKAAEDSNSVVTIAGDIFDAMQSHDDPRRRPEELKAKYKVSNYLDALVMDGIEFFSKYKVNYIMGLGNHETAVLKKLGTSLLDRLVFGISSKGGSAISMGYEGYLRVIFRYKSGKGAAMKVVYFHHGKGGNAPVTRGVIHTNRQAVAFKDADLVHNGHNHQGYIVPISRACLAQNGQPYNDVMWFIRTPGYKTGGMPAGEQFGYGVEKHPEPSPIGFVRVDYEYSKKSGIEITPVPKIK